MVKALKRIAAFKATISAHVLFAAIASVFGLLFVFGTPLLWGADETTHVGRVYELSHGQLLAGVVHEGYSKYGFGGRVPENLKKLIDHVHVDINLDNTQKIPGVKKVDDVQVYKDFAKMPLDGKRVEFNFSNTSIYSPVSYAPSIVGFWTADLLGLKIGPTIHLARLFDLMLYIGTVTFIIRSLRMFKSKWIIFVMALIPAALFQASIINADAVTNTLAFALVGMVLKALLSKRLSRTEATVLITATILLPIAKPSYLFITFLTLLIPSHFIIVNHEKYRRFLMPIAILMGLSLYALWQYKTSYLTNASKWMIAGIAPWWQGIDSTAQLRYVVLHPFMFIIDFLRTLTIFDDTYLNSLLGTLGFGYVQIPAVSMVAILVAICLAVLGSESKIMERRRVLLTLGVLVASIMAVFGTLYLTISYVAQPIIGGVQGRYFLPVLPVFFVLLLGATKTRLNIPTRKAYRSVAMTMCSLVIVSLIASTIKYFYIVWG